MQLPAYIDPLNGKHYSLDTPHWCSDEGKPLLITPQPGIEAPASIVIPAGKASVDIDIKADVALPAGRRNFNLNATAQVNGFEEEQRGRFEVECVKAQTKK